MGFSSCASIGVFVGISLSIVTINNWVKLGHRVIIYFISGMCFLRACRLLTVYVAMCDLILETGVNRK